MKTLGTRQKRGFRIEPSQKTAKPRNPITVAAKLRAAGPHQKTVSGKRQLQKRALKKMLIEPDES